MDKKFSKESDSTAEDMDKIKKCVEEGKQRLNWIGKNVLNIQILNNSLKILAVAEKTDECDIAFEFSRCMTPA